jgi:uncharacterized protein YbjT (DUF2867 family)
MPDHAVLVAGATGLIGRELVAQSLDAGLTVHALARRAPAAAAARPGLHWLNIDYPTLPVLPKASQAYCALGTTLKVAGSQAAFRAVDFDAVLHFARACRACGVMRFAVVSSLGADATSGNFYSRVKGEMEAALSVLGFASLVIARPSLLAGDRTALGQPARLGERLVLAASAPLAPLMPKAWRPIQAATVARGMRAALAQAQPGTRIVSSGELQELGA